MPLKLVSVCGIPLRLRLNPDIAPRSNLGVGRGLFSLWLVLETDQAKVGLAEECSEDSVYIGKAQPLKNSNRRRGYPIFPCRYVENNGVVILDTSYPNWNVFRYTPGDPFACCILGRIRSDHTLASRAFSHAGVCGTFSFSNSYITP